jgi:nucleotide-binding universal stress UspA family protein
MEYTYRIVVGIDGSEGGARALRWAMEHAAARGGAVQAITVWNWAGNEAGVPVASTPAIEMERARKTLDEAVGHVVSRYPQVPLASEVVEGMPAAAMAHAARDADLLVLGSHGHSRLRHAVLGSVSEECVRAARCPVVVVPVPHPEPAPSTEVVSSTTS